MLDQEFIDRLVSLPSKEQQMLDGVELGSIKIQRVPAEVEMGWSSDSTAEIVDRGIKSCSPKL